jgi:hypothetical protein
VIHVRPPAIGGGPQVLPAAVGWRLHRLFGRQASERVEAALEQAELVAFWIGEDVPGRLRGLTDVDEFGPLLALQSAALSSAIGLASLWQAAHAGELSACF